MQNLFLSTNLISVTASVLFLTYLALALPFMNKANRIVRFLVVLFLVIFILFVPVYNGFNLIKICRGVFAHLSFTTMVILFLYNLRQVFSKSAIASASILHKKQKNDVLNGFVPINLRFAIFLFIVGLVLYFSALDLFIKVDLYDLGYFPNGLLVAFIIAEMVIYFAIGRLYAWIWLGSLVLFYFRIAPSHNLWDYLFDPLLWLLAIFEIIKSALPTKNIA